MTQFAYLDNQTITRPGSIAIHQWVEGHKERWGSLKTLHQVGQPLERYAEKMTKRLLDMMGASRGKFIYCHRGAEAVNAVLFSHFIEESGRNHFLAPITSEADVLLSFKRLLKLQCTETLLEVNEEGVITPETLRPAIRPRTSLLSVPWANRLTGVLYPIEELSAVCREKDIRLHVDATAVVGKWFFRWDDLAVDYLTFDGALLHGVEGTGGILMHPDAPFHPLVVGDGENHLSGLSALTVAMTEAFNGFEQLHLEVARLRTLFEKEIQAAIPDARVLFANAERLPHITAITFPGANSEALLYLLSRKKVYASIGGGQTQKLAHVLTATGVDDLSAECAVSFGLSLETTDQEIMYAVQAIAESVQLLRACSQGGV